MFFGKTSGNTLYYNLVVNDDLKIKMLKACREVQNTSSLLVYDELSQRRERKMKKSKVKILAKDLAVALFSLVISGVLITAALTHIKKKNVGNNSQVAGKETIEVTTQGITKRVIETTIENKETEAVEESTKSVDDSKEGEESMYGEDKDIKAAIDQFDIYEDVWKGAISGEAARYGVKYTMTDLDHNGNLELIVSDIEGSGLYTNLHIFELVKGDLVERVTNLSNDCLEIIPDISLQNELVTYRSKKGNTYAYLGIDLYEGKEDGKTVKSEKKVLLSLEDGMFDVTPRASKTIVGDKVKYSSAIESIVSADVYENHDDELLDDSKDFEKSTTKIKWVDLEDGTQELLECYKTFMGEI
ncbi:hypothetical protein [Eubacterium sp.]|uniref:hypothetical protein n=1 Tax=Eubacterium sp. TaxID=142586 RepID=UPI0025F76A12|nr:hypothetical protein [Eubacterium sp.]MCR5628682.1 hypothetical protein [Eubacterium sp.]